MKQLLTDIRYASWQLRRSQVLTLTAEFTLPFAIDAATGFRIFQFVAIQPMQALRME